VIVRREIAATCVTARFSAVDRILRWTSLETGRSEPLIIVDAILRVMAIQLRETRGQRGRSDGEEKVEVNQGLWTRRCTKKKRWRLFRSRVGEDHHKSRNPVNSTFRQGFGPEILSNHTEQLM